MSAVKAKDDAIPLFGEGSRCVHIHNIEISNRTRDQKEIVSAIQGNWFETVLYVGAVRGSKTTVDHQFTACEVIHLPNGSAQRGSILKKITGFRAWGNAVEELLKGTRVDVIHAHSLPTLPLAIRLKKLTGCKVVYDCHELETEVQILNSFTKPIYKRLERKHIFQCDSVVTVSDSIADWYANAYGIKRPYIVRPVPDTSWQKLEPVVDLRGRFGVPKDRPLFIYQGILNQTIINLLIAAWDKVAPDRHIVFMGFGAGKPTVEEAAHAKPNIHFIPAVAPEDLLRYTAGADAGFDYRDPSNLSWRYTIPNKVMEYWTAGIPLVTDGIGVELDRIIKQTGAGWCVDRNAETLSNWVNSVSLQEIAQAAERTRVFAKTLSWQHEADEMRKAYEEALGKP